MPAQTINVPTNYSAVGTPTGGGGVPTCLLIAICTSSAAFATDALAGGGGGAASVPMCFYATYFKYITASHMVCAHRKQTGISLSTPPPPSPGRAEHPFPS
jgi:hypothetical protein